MRTIILDSHEQMSEKSAQLAAAYIAANPSGLLCFAAGHTQRETLQKLVQRIRQARMEVSALRLVSLDEWVGYGAGDAGSCHCFLHDNFLDPLGIKAEQYFFFDGKSGDLARMCKTADAFIDACGGIGFAILGVGLNGHLGFNEPGVDPMLRSHVTPLAKTSKDISGKYFGKRVPVQQGITLGLSDLFASRQLLVQCTGEHKAPIIGRMFALPEPDAEIPVSLVRNLDNCTLLLDRDSAGNALCG